LPPCASPRDLQLGKESDHESLGNDESIAERRRVNPVANQHHPIGATGAVLATRLIHALRRDGLKRGVVTLCIGGGQGIALAIETMP
jgi:Thiolase, C-terminal domain